MAVFRPHSGFLDALQENPSGHPAMTKGAEAVASGFEAPDSATEATLLIRETIPPAKAAAAFPARAPRPVPVACFQCAETVAAGLEATLSGPETTFSVTDNTLSKPDNTFSMTDNTLSVMEVVLLTRTIHYPWQTIPCLTRTILCP